jgi:hypothetical protein
MTKAKRNLLADREVVIQIDDHRLSAPVVLELAAVRLSLELDVLTEVSKVFVEEDVVPRITKHLSSIEKQECSLYLPGEDVARPVERLVANVVTKPLLAELEQVNAKKSSVAVGTEIKTSVHLIVRTQPAEGVPCFVPVEGATGDSLVTRHGNKQSGDKSTPPVRC